MAKNWIVLTADRGGFLANEIFALTGWDDYVPKADEVVYSDPVDVNGDAVDALWKIRGSVTLANGVYTYVDASGQATLANRQRKQIHDAYLFWRIFGRTSHWAGIRAVIDATDSSKFDPLEACDKWAYHIVALVDQAINGVFPITGAFSAQALQDFIDHADNIFRTLGPTWYDAQIVKLGEGTTMHPDYGPTEHAKDYRGLAILAGTTIYTDIVSITGSNTNIDGDYESVGVVIRNGFNAESPTLGN